MATNHWSFYDYAVRVSDPEGIRRAALLVAELRAVGASKNEAAQHVAVSEHLDPIDSVYDNRSTRYGTAALIAR